jgi:hypothetical protein
LKFSAVVADIFAEGIFMFASCLVMAACHFCKGTHESHYPIDNNDRRGDCPILRRHQLVTARTVYRSGGRVYPLFGEKSRLDSNILTRCRGINESLFQEYDFIERPSANGSAGASPYRGGTLSK